MKCVNYSAPFSDLRFGTVILMTLTILFLCGEVFAQPKNLAGAHKFKVKVKVIDKSGLPVTDLRPEELRLLLDKTQLQTLSFSIEEVPVSYGLVVDTSGSIRQNLATVLSAAKSIVGSNNENDRTFVVRLFRGDAVSTDWTANKKKLLELIDQFTSAGGLTALLEALIASSQKFDETNSGKDDPQRQRCLILLTDGLIDKFIHQDANQKLSEAISALKKRGVPVVSIQCRYKDPKGGLEISIDEPSPTRLAEIMLKTLAEETNGRAFTPQSPMEWEKIAAQVINIYRLHYTLEFISPELNEEKVRKLLRVTLIKSVDREKSKARILSVERSLHQP